MAKQKSIFAERLDRVQKSVHPVLRDAGFKKRGRTFNRAMESGLVHVVNFQMGQYPIGDYEIPGIRESVYGRFTVNMGIFVPCMFFLEHSEKERDFYQEYCCDIRMRLGLLANSEDTWWWLTEQVEDTADVMSDLLKEYAFPFFGIFETYEDIRTYYDEYSTLPSCTAGRSKLIVAVILDHLGLRHESETMFRCLVRSIERVGFLRHVQGLGRKLRYNLRHEQTTVDLTASKAKARKYYRKLQGHPEK